LRGSFGKTEIGALIAGKTSKAALATPARINLKAKLFADMVFSLCCSPFADVVCRKPIRLRCTLSVGPAHYLLVYGALTASPF
jgi:hypothetical protein